LNKKLLKERKVLLITGTTGYLGRNFVKAAAKRDQFEIYTLDRDKKRAESLFSNLDHMKYFNHIDLKEGEFSLSSVDVLVHTAFARPHRGQEEIARSLSFTNELFTHAVMSHLPAVINISSQSVYGLKHPPLWKEDLPLAPETPYAQAKYASELMARSGKAFNNQTVFTSLRMATLSGGQDGFETVDLLSKLTKKALSGESLRIVGGQQEIERLDVRDAIEAILAVIDLDPAKWKEAYNVGPGNTYHLIEIAEKVVVECSKVTINDPPGIMIEEKEVNLKHGLDITRIIKDTGWNPRFSMDEIITSVVQYLKNTI
jgi:nucleoside-diphosphate-sugar epimerase